MRYGTAAYIGDQIFPPKGVKEDHGTSEYAYDEGDSDAERGPNQGRRAVYDDNGYFLRYAYA